MKYITLTTKDKTKAKVKIWSVDEIISNGAFQKFTFTFKLLYNTKNPKYKKVYLTDFITFDIETSTTAQPDTSGEYINYTWVYHWQMTVFGVLIMGRTWGEFDRLMHHLQQAMQLSKDKKCLVFVHNLPYEFAFIHGRYPIIKLFARAPHEPMTAEFGGHLLGFEFRCTYANTGKSLAQVAEDTTQCPYLKSKKDLDHTKIRTSKTKLTKTELGYCAKDVLILDYYIQHCIEIEHQWDKIHGFVASIPLTKTGYIRREAKRILNADAQWVKLKQKLKLSGVQYVMSHYAFRGGDVHGQAWACGQTFDNVKAKDLTSSYPFQLIAQKYPCSPPRTVESPTFEDLVYLLNHNKLFIIDITFTDLNFNGIDYFPYLPSAKCGAKNITTDNGRIITASECRTVVTNIDLKIIFDNYEYSEIFINKLFYFEKSDYLPDCFTDLVFKYYKLKTTLKGIAGEETRYLQSKERVNSIYGMTVTSQIYDECLFENGEWTVETTPLTYANAETIDTTLQAEYKKSTYFLPYIIGVYVTAYARQDLHSALSKIKSDAIYWDTDSVKFINEYGNIFTTLNNAKIEHLMELGYNIDDYSPKDTNGTRHPIGLWDDEYNGNPVKFKTFGAKKYVYIENGSPHITISGLKKSAAEYIQNKIEDITEVELGYTVPATHSGRTTSQYIEEPFELTINGVTVSEQSYMNIIPTTYTLGDTIEHKLYTLKAYQYRKERDNNEKI